MLAHHEPVVAIEDSPMAQPIAEKVINLMTECDGAIICVNDDRVVQVAESDSSDYSKTATPQLNANVLIEIGAALALFPKRFILIWQEGLNVPSNLSGIIRFTVSGQRLSLDEGFKLIETLLDPNRWFLRKDQV